MFKQFIIINVLLLYIFASGIFNSEMARPAKSLVGENWHINRPNHSPETNYILKFQQSKGCKTPIWKARKVTLVSSRYLYVRGIYDLRYSNCLQRHVKMQNIEYVHICTSSGNYMQSSARVTTLKIIILIYILFRRKSFSSL